MNTEDIIYEPIERPLKEDTKPWPLWMPGYACEPQVPEWPLWKAEYTCPFTMKMETFCELPTRHLDLQQEMLGKVMESYREEIERQFMLSLGCLLNTANTATNHKRAIEMIEAEFNHFVPNPTIPGTNFHVVEVSGVA